MVNLKKQLAFVQALLQPAHLDSPSLVRCGKHEHQLSRIIIIIIIIIIIVVVVVVVVVGRDSSVCIATRYGLDDPKIESRLGRDFPHPSRPALGPTRPPSQ